MYRLENAGSNVCEAKIALIRSAHGTALLNVIFTAIKNHHSILLPAMLPIFQRPFMAQLLQEMI